MTHIIEDRLPQIVALCRRHHVRRLELFGSATGDGFRPDASDFDSLVEIAPLSPADHADSYFGLLHGLEDLFALQVDLLERGPIRNPYLFTSIDENKVVLYEAA